MEVNGDVIALLQHVFRMCDVDNQGRISVADLLHLGQKHLGHDNQVRSSTNQLIRPNQPPTPCCPPLPVFHFFSLMEAVELVPVLARRYSIECP